MKEFPHYRVILLIIIHIIFIDTVKAQENVFLHPKKFYKKFFPKLRIKRVPVDTAYIKSYPNFLAIGFHVFSPTIALNMKPKMSSAAADETSRFRTNVSDIAGFSGSYRHLNVGFSLLLNSHRKKEDDYATTRYHTATIKFNSPSYYLQFKYLKIKGFTDINAHNNLDVTRLFLRRSDLVMKEFQFEGMYNFGWKKYSYLAPLTFSQRQVKSRMGFLLKAGAYYNELLGQSAIITKQQQLFYPDLDSVRVIRSLTIRFAPGVGGNLVFLRRIYFSVMAFASYDLYFYRYLQQPEDKVPRHQNFIMTLDAKISLGYQSERLYAGVRYEGEHRGVGLNSMHMNMAFNYVGLELGYRFNTPQLVKKVYKDTMPPGM